MTPSLHTSGHTLRLGTWAVVASLGLLCGAAEAQDVHNQDVHNIVQRSVEANQRDWEAAPQFEYTEQDCHRDGQKTYEELMILGSPYERLVELNGKRLSAEQQQQEERKLKEAISERSQESASKRRHRIAKYEADRKRDQAMMNEMVKAFDFKIQGEGKLDGHDVYILQATPHAGYRPPTMETKALTGMKGTLWIDKATYQWVKVEAEVVRPVSIDGVLAKVQPGTRFELEKVPVAPGVWLPKHFAMQSRAKILLIHNYQDNEENHFYNFRRIQKGPAEEHALSADNRTK